MANRDSPDFYQISLRFDTLFQSLIEDQKKIEITFIKKNPVSLASLIVLNYKFGMVPVLNMDADLHIYKKLDSTLSLKYPSNKLVLFHHSRVTEYQRQEREKESMKKPKF